ncbi:MAG: diguanylate cyclase [Acidobacteria bacterium]|nr:diguanylate cyclase [Acidobacteriota bacterium]
MEQVKDRSTDSRVPITLIVIAAVGSLLFTLGGGYFLFRNTRNLVDARNWVEHTQDVLLGIQNASRRADQVQYSTRIFMLTRHDSDRQASQRSALLLQSAVVHLQSAVADNPAEAENIRQLEQCSNGVIVELAKQDWDETVANNQLLTCQQVLASMTEQERKLLKERTDASQQQSQFSLFTESGLAIPCLLVLIALFSLLLRDALMRNRIAKASRRTNAKLATNVKTLHENAHVAKLLALSRDELQLCTEVQQVYRAAADRFSQLLPETSGALCIINSSRNLVERVASWPDPEQSVVSEIFAPENCCGLRSGQLRWKGTGASAIDCEHFSGEAPGAYFCVPLVAQGETTGVLFVECPTEEARQNVERRDEGVRQLVQLTAMTLASIELRKKLERQSIRDGLTGLFNRHFMQIAFDRELARSTRRKSTLAVLMLDVDHFKQFNDQFGHAAGDTVLKEVARVIGSSVRAEDLVCRYGGEEFTIILPDIGLDAIKERAEKVRQAIEDLRTQIGNHVRGDITISIGGALFPRDGQTSEELLKCADAALYRAKHEGRNRVVIEA